jgi:uncharacterized protein DUF3597
MIMSVFGTILAAVFQGIPSAPPETEKPFASGYAGPPGAPPSPSEADKYELPIIRKVDVDAVLTARASRDKKTLDWRRSIVDLMKLLDLDSSLAARKELAQELGFTGDVNDTAHMNNWLHTQVMQKLADNGGKVSAELLH